MKVISVVAAGTRGDVQPYIALGMGLKDAGYDVRLLTSDDFETLVTEAGLTFCSMGKGAEAILQSEEWRRTMERGNAITLLRKMRSEMQRNAMEMAGRTPDLLAGSDLVAAGMGGLTGAFTIAEHLHIPYLQAYVFPFTPTHSFASPLVSKLPLGGALNRLSFQAMRQMMWQTLKVSDVTTRQLLGLGKGSFWGPYRSLAEKGVPALYGYSPYVLPRPHDWPENHVVTGYWFLDAPSDWTPPADLMAFLDAGEPPVYIGFGSMGNRNPEAAAQIALEALQRSGQRGVLASGWGGLEPADLPKTVHVIGSIPHSWLFPRMAAVVHHGGAGTAAAGMRAGVPSIIVPFGVDQPFWGGRIAELGVGPTPIPRKRLTAEGLASAISESMSNSAMRQKADALGQAIRAEDGVGNAVAVIDRFMERLPAPRSAFAAISS